MRFDQFFGGSYQSQAFTADQERTVNWIPEVLQSPGATSKLVLYPSPGVQVLDTAALDTYTGAPISGVGRAHYNLGTVELAAVGKYLYQIDAGGSWRVWNGDLIVDDLPATICGNGDGDYLVTSGGGALCLRIPTASYMTLTSLRNRATMGDYLDGRFLLLDAITDPPALLISAIFDGFTWTPGTDYAERTLAPDPWRAMKVVGRYIWLFGEKTTEIWQDVGANFPFAPIPGGVLPYGIAAPYSACRVGDGIAWLAVNEAGRRCVMYSGGQTPEVISTYPLEAALGDYDSVETAVGDSYSDRGHTFYLLSIEDEPETTYVFDLETKLWHERATWRSELNKYEAWRPRFHAFAFGEHRVLDSAGGSLYKMHSALTTDVDSLLIRRMRRTPALQAENKRVFYPRFELDVEPGLGLGDDTPNKPKPSMVSFTMTRTTGRLLAIDDADWASNVNNGYDTYQADHDKLLEDIVYLLTGKRTGANILIVAQLTTGIWGSQFTSGLSRLGHTYTQTMTASTLAGYVMGNFDMTIMLTLTGGDALLIDPYLDANGAILTALVGLNNSTWTRYGFATSPTTNQAWKWPPSHPMVCSVLGRSPYNKFAYTSPTYIATTATILTGTTTLFQNAFGEDMAALWEKS